MLECHEKNREYAVIVLIPYYMHTKIKTKQNKK